MTITNVIERDLEAIHKVRDLIQGIDIAMLTTVTEAGLVSRPMKTQEVEFDGDLWFITMKDTDKYDELSHNPNVNVAYVGRSYVSIRGTAELVESKEKLKEYWNIAYEKMLGTTSDDPNLVLIKVNADTAEYWEMGHPLKMFTQLINKLTGEKSDDAEMNKVVDFNR